MPKTWSEWTDEEEQRIREMRRDRLSRKEMAEELGRSLESISHKLHRLGLPKPGRRIRHWRHWETKRLRQFYETYETADEIQKRFPGRTLDSIHLKARQIGLRRRGRATAYRTDPEALRRIRNLSNFKLGYIAGILDGEGCVTHKNGITRITVGSTSLRMLEWMKSEIGGNINAAKAKANRRPFWLWALSQHQVVSALLNRLKPHLLIKKIPA